MALLDIREYYQKDGNYMLPGRKGISLRIEQFDALPTIEAFAESGAKALAGADGDEENERKRKSEAGEQAASASKRSKTIGEESAGVASSTSESVDTRKTATGKQRQNAQGEPYYALNESGTRRLTLRVFKGASLFDIREFYSKDGALMPGRKGLALRADQFERIRGISDKVAEQLAAASSSDPSHGTSKKDTGEKNGTKSSTVEDGEGNSTTSDTADPTSPVALARRTNDSGEVFYELSRTRRLTIRSWKGRMLVDIREYYEKDGTMRPGKKGISLTGSQWDLLRGIMNALPRTRVVGAS
eukprot:g1118.t1